MTRVVAVGVALLLASCTSSAPAAPASPPSCVDVVAFDNSPGTNAVFQRRRCQGGGVTWGAILAAAHPGLAHADEGDAVRVCGAQGDVDAVRTTYARLNADAVALEAAMNATSALLMECAEADGSPPRLPKALSVPIEGL
jgi:hypothetical protein